MSVLRKGDRVLHASYGAGTIDAKMVFGDWRVRFDAAPTLPRTVRGSDLRPEGEVCETLEAHAGAGRAGDAVAKAVNHARPEPKPEQEPRPKPAGDVQQKPTVHAPPSPSIDATLAEANRKRTRPKPVLLTVDPNESTGVGCPIAWQTLEALRLGVVPAHGVEEYTVARASELAEIRKLLGGRRGCRVIWGEYGTGKTHLLNAAEQLALEQGFATARITIDPNERSLHRPLRLYQKIIESVRTAELVSQGFTAIFDRLVDSPEHYRADGDRASRFFSPYLHVLRYGRDDQVALLRDYVCGERVPTPEVNRILHVLGWRGKGVLGMSDYRTYGRMYTHLISTLATWCADAGTCGLALFFDEVERVDALDSINRRRAMEVLRHLAAVTIKTKDLAFDPEDLYKGGHLAHRLLPLRFRGDQPLTAVFALTPLEETQERFKRVTESHDYDLTLEGLSRQCVGDLVRRIAGIYRRAYASYTPANSVVASIKTQIANEVDGGHDNFRAVVRAAVFLLDADRFGTETQARAEFGSAQW